MTEPEIVAKFEWNCSTGKKGILTVTKGPGGVGASAASGENVLAWVRVPEHLREAATRTMRIVMDLEG